MKIEFRPCVKDDLETAIPLIYSSGPAQFRFVFSVSDKEQALEFLRFCFQQEKGQFSFTNHTTVIVNGEQVGVGALWTSKSNMLFMLSSALQIFRFFGLFDALKVIVRGLRTETVIKPARKSASYIGHLGISESMRGRGLGRHLIAHFSHESKQMGFKKVSLDVECDNRRAKKLYESLGFIDREENKSTLKNQFGYVLTHFYMERELD